MKMNELTSESTFMECAEVYLTNKILSKNTASEVFCQRAKCQINLYPLLGYRAINDLRYSDCISALRKLKTSNYSDTYIISCWCTIKQVVSMAVNQNLIEKPDYLDKKSTKVLMDIDDTIECVSSNTQPELLPQLKNSQFIITRNSSMLSYLIYLHNNNDTRGHHKIPWHVIIFCYQYIDKNILNKSISDINCYDIQTICFELNHSSYSQAYIRYVLQIIRFEFSFAFHTGLLEKSFNDRFSFPHYVQGDKFYFNDIEYNLIKTEINKSIFRNLYVLIGTIGLTKSEALALQNSHYDKEKNELTINGYMKYKNSQDYQIMTECDNSNFKKRTICLPKVTAEAINDEIKKTRLKKERSGEKWNNALNLIFTDDDGKPIPKSVIDYDIRSIRFNTGIESFSIKNLRKHCIYIMIKNKVQVTEIKELLGLKSTRTILDKYDIIDIDNDWRKEVI